MMKIVRKKTTIDVVVFPPGMQTLEDSESLAVEPISWL